MEEDNQRMENEEIGVAHSPSPTTENVEKLGPAHISRPNTLMITTTEPYQDVIQEYTIRMGHKGNYLRRSRRILQLDVGPVGWLEGQTATCYSNIIPRTK